jgi:hypothetical protein
MRTTATAIRRADPAKAENVPSGTYDGLWSGYSVVFSAGGVMYECQTRDGVRGIRIQCLVTIADGQIVVTT